MLAVAGMLFDREANAVAWHHNLTYQATAASAGACSSPLTLTLSVTPSGGQALQSATTIPCGPVPIAGSFDASFAHDGLQGDDYDWVGIGAMDLRTPSDHLINVDFTGDVVANLGLGMQVTFGGGLGLSRPSLTNVSDAGFSIQQQGGSVAFNFLIEDLTLSLPGIPDLNDPALIGSGIAFPPVDSYGTTLGGTVTVRPSGTTLVFDMSPIPIFNPVDCCGVLTWYEADFPDGIESIDLRLSGAPPYTFFSAHVEAWNPTPVPEPSTCLLLATGLAGLAVRRRLPGHPSGLVTVRDSPGGGSGPRSRSKYLSCLRARRSRST